MAIRRADEARFIPIILLQVFAGLVDVGAFDTPLLLTPGLIAVQNIETITLLICLLILFYTTESLKRERSTGFAAIHDTAPIRSLAILLGKCLTNVVLGLVIVLTALAGFAIVLLVQGRVQFSLGPFTLVWGLLLTPTFLVWTAFVCASFAVTRNHIGAYVLGLLALSVTGFFEAREKMTWTFNWARCCAPTPRPGRSGSTRAATAVAGSCTTRAGSTSARCCRRCAARPEGAFVKAPSTHCEHRVNCDGRAARCRRRSLASPHRRAFRAATDGESGHG